MKKYIFIVNGKPRCGKDTFASILNTFVPTMKYSSIDKVKDIATACGWDGTKTETARKFLSDLKQLTTDFNDMSFNAVKEKVDKFQRYSIYRILLIDIREPEEIKRAQKEFGAYSVLIENDRVENVVTNSSDANVYNYTYDYCVKNNGTIDEFRDNIREFLKEVGVV